MAKLVQGILLGREQIGEDYFSLRVKAPSLVETALPGQFIQLKCGETLDPLLRRPISIHRYQKKEGVVEFLVRRKGKGTKWLGRQKPGTSLDLLGPLGKGFSLTAKPALLAGGGIGIAPVLALAEALAHQGNKPIVLLGANSIKDLLKLREFQGVSQRVRVATIDGSLGRQGLVTDLLDRELEDGFTGFIYTCGPEPMMGAVARAAEARGLKGEASLEATMACGIGVCLGCTCRIEGKEGKTYAHVCTDGPVFPLEVVRSYGES